METTNRKFASINSFSLVPLPLRPEESPGAQRFSFGRTHFARQFDFAQFLAAIPQVLARFRLHIALGSFHTALEFDRIAFEKNEPLDRLPNFFESGASSPAD